MADEAPADEPEIERITVLMNDNDVLLGRGRGSSKFIGNARFLALVETRKEEYNAVSSYTVKKAIGREIFLEITQKRKGRFLKLVDCRAGARNVVEEGTWCVASDKAAEEKCKQALREKREGHQLQCLAEVGEENGQVGDLPVEDTSDGTSSGGVSESLKTLQERETDQVHFNGGGMGPYHSEPTYCSNSSRDQFGANSNASTCAPPQSHHDAQVAFINCFLNSPTQTLMLPKVVMNASIPHLHPILHGMHENLVFPHPPPFKSSQHCWEESRRMGPVHLPSFTDHIATLNPAFSMYSGALREATTMAEEHASAVSQENNQIQQAEIDALVGLSALSLADRPKFTEAQEAIERANMTDEERAAALSDLFGTYCKEDSPKQKRAKRDLDSESIDFLVRQMRAELMQIPYAKKEALVEAQAKCRSTEFSDRRLEQFLRCEGMNAKLGAERFVNYWESRREIFGSKKYLMRMTLDEALKDDLAAIEDGLLCILPYRDLFGRQVLFLDPHRRSPNRYSSQSLLRALWYTIEVASQENNDRNSGFVYVNWFKSTTIFDYDKNVWDPFVYFEANCFPLQSIAGHSCCSSSIFMQVVKPVLYALLDKRARSRCIYHTVPESEIIHVLLEYGIMKCILPTEMGGTLRFSQWQWMADRRAVEMEEL